MMFRLCPFLILTAIWLVPALAAEEPGSVAGTIEMQNFVGDLTLTPVRIDLKRVGFDSRLDVNGDGVIDQADLELLQRIVNFQPFEWTESFESYPVGLLTGKGPWIAPDTLPGSVLSRAWVSTGMQVTQSGGALSGTKKAAGAQAYVWHGNEARFHNAGGFDSVGVLRVGFISRVGSGAGYENTGFHIWNSTDAEGKFGNFTVEQARSGVSLASGRGVTLTGTRSATVQGGQTSTSKGIAIELLIDFESSKLTWKCLDLDYNKTYGPFEVTYTGTVKGLDGISIIADTPDAQIDGLYVRNY